jgi:hypothetical protein
LFPKEDEATPVEKPKKKKKRVKKPTPQEEEDHTNIPALTKDDIEIREDLSDNERVLMSDD